jgi:hypothetical protein
VGGAAFAVAGTTVVTIIVTVAGHISHRERERARAPDVEPCSAVIPQTSLVGRGGRPGLRVKLLVSGAHATKVSDC